MDMIDAISVLDAAVPDPSAGLPDPIFYYISRNTPLVNVDLLVQDERGRSLLAWRSDPHAGVGWHIPGGIVRYKESFADRLRKVAVAELGTDAQFDPAPLSLHELINQGRRDRGHFISLLYRCRPPPSYEPCNEGRAPGERGFLAWHHGCPTPLIRYHEIYRAVIDAGGRGAA
jgi:colanic acid biosynthesis protein WcaH